MNKTTTTTKTALIEHYELNHVIKLNQLLHGITLQSCMERPSDLLHRMKNLIGLDGKFSYDLQKKLFLDRMPANVRLILAANYELNLHDVAVMDNSVFMFSNSESVYARPNTNFSDCRPTPDFDYERANSSVLTQTYVNSNLQSQINSMADELQDLKKAARENTSLSPCYESRPKELNSSAYRKNTYQSIRPNFDGASVVSFDPRYKNSTVSAYS